MTKQAKDDELTRRISDALDAEGGLDADPALRAQLEQDPEALSYAQDLVRIDEVLKGFGAQRREPDWEALASAIDGRLDEPLPPLEVDAPPVFVDAEADRQLEAGSLDVSQEVAVFSEPPPERGPAEVVDLGARRGRRNAMLAWMSGLAAAAAVAVGVSSGVVTFDAESPAAESAAAAPIFEEGEAVEQAAAEEARGLPAPLGGGTERAEPASAPAEEASSPAPLAGFAEVGEPEPRRDPPEVAEREQPSTFDALRAQEEPSDIDRESALPARSRGTGGGIGLRRSRRRARPAPAAGQLEAPASRPRRADGRFGNATTSPARTPGTSELASLRRAEPAVQRCLASVGELARVTLRVAAGGEIVGVEVRPPYGDAARRCIANALRQVRLASRAEPYALTHTFRPPATPTLPARQR